MQVIAWDYLQDFRCHIASYWEWLHLEPILKTVLVLIRMILYDISTYGLPISVKKRQSQATKRNFISIKISDLQR